jgi:hypothetical protein
MYKYKINPSKCTITCFAREKEKKPSRTFKISGTLIVKTLSLGDKTMTGQLTSQ